MSVLQPGKHLIQNNKKPQTVLCAGGVSYNYKQDEASNTIVIPPKMHNYKLIMHKFH